MGRFSAFISYSHADQAAARWLHHAIETFRIPKSLVGTPSPFGDVPRRLPPVFRDRDELHASADLGEQLREALAESRFQIVLCSPHAAISKWVNEEILSFKRLHGESNTLALIVGGEPYAGDDTECFPPALRFRLAPDGTLSDDPAEPIAADLRPGKDGRRLALLKLIAGITGLRLDALAPRDAARRQRRLAILAGVSLSIAVVTIGLAIYAEAQRRVAESQRRLADRSLEFLICTFAIANPATENPRTITAMTILDRASRRAGTELASEPAVSAKLLATTGEIYFNLGLMKESERDLEAALARQPGKGEDRARTLLHLADLAAQRGDTAALERFVGQAGDAAGAGASPLVKAGLLNSRAKLAFQRGRYAQSAALFGEAGATLRAADGDNREQSARSETQQAKALTHLRRFDEADALFALAVQQTRAKFGLEHVQTAKALHNRALGDLESGRLDAADRRIRQAIAIYARVLDGDHPSIADALLLQGRIGIARGDGTGAIMALDRARLIYAHLYGPDNAAVGDTDFYAALAEAKRGDIDAALRLQDRTKAIYDHAYGPDDPDQVELLLARAGVLARGNRIAEAHRTCAAGLALQIRLDPGDPTLADTRKTCSSIGRAPIVQGQ